MNTTMIWTTYDIPQKATLPFLSLPCALVCFLMYKYGRRRLKRTETLDSRMINLYSIVAGGTLGQFFFHTLPNSTIPVASSNYAGISVFILLGFFVMLCFQKCGRVCTGHTYYTGPENTSTEIGYTIDRNAMEQNEYMLIDDIENDKKVKTEMWAVRDEEQSIRKRVVLATLFCVVMLLVSTLEGFFLASKLDPSNWTTDPATLIVMYYFNKIIQTIIFCIVMLYGLFHIPKNTRNKKAYHVYSLIWCISTIISTFPAVLGMSKFDALMVLNNSILNIVYACVGGVLFWMALYFVWIDKRFTNKKETAKRLVLFALFAALSFATGYFI